MSKKSGIPLEIFQRLLFVMSTYFTLFEAMQDVGVTGEVLGDIARNLKHDQIKEMSDKAILAYLTP